MSVTITEGGHILIEGSASIQTARLLALHTALGLEIKGIRMNRGQSAYHILRAELKLKGTRQKVYDQVAAMLATLKATPGAVNDEQ